MICWELVILVVLVIIVAGTCRRAVAGFSGRRSNYVTAPYCNQATHACVGCVADIDCASGRCDPATNQCVGCMVDADCPDGVCDPATRACVKCTADNRTKCGPGQQCANNTCVDCVADADCPGRGYDGGPGVCVAGVCAECRDDASCPAGAKHCGAGKCYVCADDSGCGGETPFCMQKGGPNARGLCVGCRTWRDCGAEKPNGADTSKMVAPGVLCGPHGRYNDQTGECKCDPDWVNGPDTATGPGYCRACAPGRGPPGDCTKDLHTEEAGSRVVFAVPGGDSSSDFDKYCFFSDTGDDKLNASCQAAFGPRATVYKMPNTGHNNDWNPCNDDSDKACSGANVSRPVCKVPRYYTNRGANVDDGAFGLCNVNGPASGDRKTTSYPPGFDSKDPLLWS